MPIKRHSLKDIARKLSVSVTTVSFVLNGKAREKGISEKVTKMVQDYIEEINYKPNQLAQSLRTGKSKILVFMADDISNSFFASIARGIEDIAYDNGYKVLFCSNENDDKRARELIALFSKRQVDGFIISPSPNIKNSIKALMDDNIPVVLVDRHLLPGLRTHYVIIDNENAVYNATKHLIENRFKNICFITTIDQQAQMADRLKGYRKAIGEHGLKENILFTSGEKNSSESKEEKIRNHFSSHRELDAVFFATNYLTQTGLMVIKENFPAFLKDWGIMAFDDNEFYSILQTPSISAVSQPIPEIVNELMEIMWSLLREKRRYESFRQVVLKASLEIRESSKAKQPKEE